MEVIVELNSFGFDKYNLDILTSIAKETIESAGVVEGEIDLSISVAIVEGEEMKKINKELRNKEEITDVISIGDYSDDNDISEVEISEVFLGEVVLCYNYIKESAQENSVSVDEEFFTVYSHGILHLLGFEHGDEMFQLQKKRG